MTENGGNHEMSTTQEKETRTCPQCEGAGQEEIGASPVVCRKCGGSGTAPAMKRVAAFMCGGTLEKRAQGELDDPADDPVEEIAEEFKSQDAESDDNEFRGPGYNVSTMYNSSKTEAEIKESIIGLFRQISDTPQMAEMFERILAVLKVSPEQVKSEIAREIAKTTMDENVAKERYVWMSIDNMNRKQLCSTHAEALRLT